MRSQSQLGATSAVLTLMACLLLPLGCGPPRVAPPGPRHSALGKGQDCDFEFLVWDDGLRVLLVSDLDHSHFGATEQGGYGGKAFARDGRSYSWHVELREGKTPRMRINDKVYDCSQGTLFVVRTKGGTTESYQLSRDLTRRDPNGSDIPAFLDDEVMRLLRGERQVK